MNPSHEIPIHFNQGSQLGLYITLGFIMFGVALSLRKETFITVFKQPKSLLVGLLSQWLMLPLLTLLLVFLLKPSPGVACGMFLMAAVPGGNISNYITKTAGGNTALSVVLTVISTLSAILFTPLNFGFWSSYYEPMQHIKRSFSLNPIEVAESILILTVIPVLGGMLFSKLKPVWAAKIDKPVSITSGLILLFIIVKSIFDNYTTFIEKAHLVLLNVVLLNAGAFLIGWFFSRVMKLSREDSKTISIETGIQNAALALVLIIQFFDKNGEAALTAAVYGIWHIISGLGWAFIIKRKISQPFNR